MCEREGIRAYCGIGFVVWFGCGALGRHVGQFSERAWRALSKARLEDMEAIIFAPLRICMWWEIHGMVIGR